MIPGFEELQREQISTTARKKIKAFTLWSVFKLDSGSSEEIMFSRCVQPGREAPCCRVVICLSSLLKRIPQEELVCFSVVVHA